MASATGMPQQPPRASEEASGRETEPLLGRPGDALQGEGQSIFSNLVKEPPSLEQPQTNLSAITSHSHAEKPAPTKSSLYGAIKFWTKQKLMEVGTGLLAQIALVLLFILIYASVLLKNPNTYSLFSAHPLLQTFGLFALVQAILIVQPTHTQEQKRKAQVWHGSLNLTAFLSFAAGVSIIEYNKGLDVTHHFKSVHGYLGVITTILILTQFVIGFTMWLLPGMYGGVENAKALYKYHRLSGYVVVFLLFATVVSASKTDAAINMLKLSFWGTLVLSALVLAGIYPRVQLSKLGNLVPRRG